MLDISKAVIRSQGDETLDREGVFSCADSVSELFELFPQELKNANRKMSNVNFSIFISMASKGIVLLKVKENFIPPLFRIKCPNSF